MGDAAADAVQEGVHAVRGEGEHLIGTDMALQQEKPTRRARREESYYCKDWQRFGNQGRGQTLRQGVGVKQRPSS